jgi:Spy/CpxP family protein refolding chaperone
MKVVGLFLLVFCVAATPLHARPDQHGGPGMRPPHPEQSGFRGRSAEMMKRFAEKRREFVRDLKLNEEQKIALKKFKEKREDLKIEMQRLKLEGMELMRLIKKPEALEAEVLKKVESINALQGKINLERAKNALSLKKVLTEEQFEKVVSAFEKMKRFGARLAGGGGQPSPGGHPGPGHHPGMGEGPMGDL